MQFSYGKTGLLLLCFFFIATVFCGENLEQQYDELRQMLIETWTEMRAELAQTRQSSPNSQAFDNTMTTMLLNDLLENVPQPSKDIVHPIFMAMNSPTSQLAHINRCLAILSKQRYHPEQGPYSVQILTKVLELAEAEIATLGEFGDFVRNATPQNLADLPQITRAYLLRCNLIRKQIMQLLNNMSLID